MITIEIQLMELENDFIIYFTGRAGDKGCSHLEGDVADDFRKVLKSAREEIYKKRGLGKEIGPPEIYRRTFDNPEERDQTMKGQ